MVPCAEYGTYMGHVKSSPCLSISSLSLDQMENGIEDNHLVLACDIIDNQNVIRSHALIDSGATGYAFMDKDFARCHHLPLYSLKDPIALAVIDGRPISSGAITHLTRVQLKIKDHLELIPAFITKLGGYPLTLGIPWLKHHDVAINFASNTITFESEYCLMNCTPDVTGTEGVGEEIPHFLQAYAIQRALDHKVLEEPKVREIVPPEYHNFMPIFLEKTQDHLLPHRPEDHTIPLKPDFNPPFGPLYNLAPPELEALRGWLDENLEKDFIRLSSSSAASPILFIKKKDGSLRLCVDYRALNAGTIKDRGPLPLLTETFMQIAKAKIFTKLDIRGAYNLIRMKKEEEWKTAFRT